MVGTFFANDSSLSFRPRMKAAVLPKSSLVTYSTVGLSPALCAGWPGVLPLVGVLVSAIGLDDPGYCESFLALSFNSLDAKVMTASSSCLLSGNHGERCWFFVAFMSSARRVQPIVMESS